jgi:hypothetical protein
VLGFLLRPLVADMTRNTRARSAVMTAAPIAD